jgi:4-hydroxy-tetrahydrodipicolinate synthase
MKEGFTMSIFKGAGVAIVTPFHEDGSVNYEKLQELIDFQIENGTDAIIICGTTGESATLSAEEHDQVIAFAVKAVNKRVPVIAGTGSNCTAAAIRASQEAEAAGADALLIVTPYYNKATQKGLIEHYTAIANAVTLPIIVYNVPSRTGCNILPETMAALTRDVKNIVAIKEASGNISQIAKLARLAGDTCDIYSGNDDQIVPILSLGGIGVISVLSNVAPRQTHEICQKFFDGDVAGSLAMQLEALPLIDSLFCEVNPIPVKTALNLMGREAGPLRAPMCEMEPQHVERLTKDLKDYGLL